jgi:osmotically-inducible protein OsmY
MEAIPMTAAALSERQDQEDTMAAIEAALWRYEPVRSRPLPIWLNWEGDGVVGVHGNTPTRIIKQGVIEIVRTIDGVRSVHDEVFADPDVELAVAQALASDPTTRHLAPGSVQVFADLGVVVLVGALDEADRTAVRSAAATIPGVRRVIDRLKGHA